MPQEATHWTKINGSGLIFGDACIVTHILFWPDSDADYVDIYDGRDASSGSFFCRIEAANQNTRHVGLGSGVHFGQGIYVDGIDAAVQTTVTFIPIN